MEFSLQGRVINFDQLVSEIQTALDLAPGLDASRSMGITKTRDCLMVDAEQLDLLPMEIQAELINRVIARHVPNPGWASRTSLHKQWSLSALASKSPDQVKTWIDTSVTDLTSAKTVLKAMALAILYLARLAKLED